MRWHITPFSQHLFTCRLCRVWPCSLIFSFLKFPCLLFYDTFFILVSFWPLWQFLCSLTFCSLPLPLLTLKHLLFFIGPCSRPFSLLPLPTWGISAIPAASMHQWILMMQMYVASSYVSPMFCAQIQATPNSTPSSPSSRPPPFRPAPKPPFSSSEELRPLIRHLQTSFCFRG